VIDAFSDRRSALSTQATRDHRSGAARWLCLGARWLANLLVMLLWLALLAWLTGRVLTDRFAWSQWLWWIPTPAALLVATLGLALANRRGAPPSRRRRRVLFWSACTAALTMHFAIFEHRLLRPSPPARGPALTIGHWNMTLDSYSPPNRLMEGVARLDADVMVVTSPSNTVRQAFTQLAANADGAAWMHDGWPMLMFSRLPINRVRVLVAVDLMFITLVELDAAAALGRPITLALVDLPSNPRRSRMTIAREVRRLLDEAGAPEPDIMVGDFNIPRGSASIATLFPGMTNAFDRAGHGYAGTFPRRLPLYHIDHVLVNERAGLTAARYDLIDEGLGRHRAQKAWIVNR
jgi:endonuclease/exonuclease/phosphatase family metal-dependent hydrolase